jgi:endoglucanase
MRVSARRALLAWAPSIFVCSACTDDRLTAIWLVDGGPPMGTMTGGAGGADNSDGSDAPLSGYLRTSGAQIVDSRGHAVRLTGISWYGMETGAFVPAGLWVKSLSELMGQIRSLSYNSVRLPICFRLLDGDVVIQNIDDRKNPGLNGLTGWQMLDRVVDEAEKDQLRVIIDQQGWAPGAEEDLWYDATHTEDAWVARWRDLAAHYRGRSIVVGFELHNAPRNAASGNPTWGSGGALDWWAAASRAGNAILGANPDVLVFVDGVQQVGTDAYWWGGNLLGVEQKPILLDVPNRVVYATHEYPKTIFDQPWFTSDPNYFEQLPPIWDKYWGYLVSRDTAPVWIAEFGTSTELPWLRQLLDYATSRGVNFAYKAFNPNTDPRIGGILTDDWLAVNQDRQAVIAPALAPIIP